jgi:hypothetical protein
LPDAPGFDSPPGTPDAMIDAAPVTARVRVTQERYDVDPGMPIEGVPVTVVGQATIHPTDATGIAEFPVEPDSTIIVFREAVPFAEAGVLPGGGGGQGWVYVVGGVDPGALVEVGSRPQIEGTGNLVGSVTINYPLYTGGGSGSSYSYSTDYLPCSNLTAQSSGQVVFDLYDYGCPTEQRAFQIVAIDQNTAMVAAFLSVPGVPTNQSGDLVIDASSATWETGASYDTSFTDMGDAYYAYTAIGQPTAWHVTQIDTNITTGAGTGTALDGSRTGSAQMLTAVFANSGREILMEPIVLGGTYTIDGDDLLPYVTASSYDESSRMFTWTTTAGGTAPDLVMTTFGDYDENTNASYDWFIYAPGNATSLHVPDIHDNVTSYDLPINEFVFGEVFLLEVADSDYTNLLSDIDHYNQPDEPEGYRPTQRVNISGQIGGKGLRLRRSR